MAMVTERQDLTGGPLQPLSTIPGSKLTCTGKVDCSLCNKQIWISCQPQGHVLIIQGFLDMKKIIVICDSDKILVQELCDEFLESENVPVSYDDQPTFSGGSSEDLRGFDKAEEGTDDNDRGYSEVEDCDIQLAHHKVGRRSLRQNASSKHKIPSSKHRRKKGHKSASSSYSKSKKKSVASPLINENLRTLSIKEELNVTPVNHTEETESFSSKKQSSHRDKAKRSKRQWNSRQEKKRRRKKVKDSERENLERYHHCEQCNSNIKGRSVFAIHIRNHIEPKQYVCDVCGKLFRQPSIANRHKRIVHDGWKPFGCEFCPKAFSSKSTLKNHMNMHLGSKLICHLCGKSLSSQANLKRHLTYHSGVKGFTCEICGKKFFQKSLKLAHQRVHTREIPFFCEICGKGYRQSYGLKKHLARHRRGESVSSGSGGRQPKRDYALVDGRYCCEMCGKCYASKPGLYTHIKFFHEGFVSFTCDTCGKKFPTRARMDLHYRTHTGERPFGCATCGKTFISKANRNRHEMVHTGEKPYKCAMCGKAFAQKINMSAHLKTHEKQRLLL